VKRSGQADRVKLVRRNHEPVSYYHGPRARAATARTHRLPTWLSKALARTRRNEAVAPHRVTAPPLCVDTRSLPCQNASLGNLVPPGVLWLREFFPAQIFERVCLRGRRVLGPLRSCHSAQRAGATSSVSAVPGGLALPLGTTSPAIRSALRGHHGETRLHGVERPEPQLAARRERMRMARQAGQGVVKQEIVSRPGWARGGGTRGDADHGGQPTAGEADPRPGGLSAGSCTLN
jgi:hypothetical protein